jgi:hypothetical protein
MDIPPGGLQLDRQRHPGLLTILGRQSFCFFPVFVITGSFQRAWVLPKFALFFPLDFYRTLQG